MRAVVQRVKSASVSVEGRIISTIDAGILTLLGVRVGDTSQDVAWIIKKILALRIFEDDAEKMNRSLIDVSGQHLIVSQFTLWGDASKGNRPSFIEAERPELAAQLYEQALKLSSELGAPTFGGKFGADMEVRLINDGPVTLILESPTRSRS